MKERSRVKKTLKFILCIALLLLQNDFNVLAEVNETETEIIEYDQIDTSGILYLTIIITIDATVSAAKAPALFATFVNVPSTKVPPSTPKTSPMKPLNHSYADLTSPFARTIDTKIAIIPTPNEMYCAIFV